MSRPRTDPAMKHLAKVAAQAAVVRELARQHRQARAELDRLIVAAYRAEVAVTRLAEAAQYSRDTVHAAVRPWAGKQKNKKDKEKGTANRDHHADSPGGRSRSARRALPGAGDHAEGLGTPGRVAALPRSGRRTAKGKTARAV
jgi:hypothetical protein